MAMSFASLLCSHNRTPRYITTALAAAGLSGLVVGISQAVKIGLWRWSDSRIRASCLTFALQDDNEAGSKRAQALSWAQWWRRGPSGTQLEKLPIQHTWQGRVACNSQIGPYRICIRWCRALAPGLYAIKGDAESGLNVFYFDGYLNRDSASGRTRLAWRQVRVIWGGCEPSFDMDQLLELHLAIMRDSRIAHMMGGGCGVLVDLIPLDDSSSSTGDNDNDNDAETELPPLVAQDGSIWHE